jgi:hypothetical protein
MVTFDSLQCFSYVRITNYVELSPPLEAVSRSTAQEFANFFLEPEGLLPCSQRAFH